MTAEFTNLTLSVERTLRHAFRKQAAASHEYVIFICYLYAKYSVPVRVNFEHLKNLNTKTFKYPNPKLWSKTEVQDQYFDKAEISEHEFQTFTLKYNRLVKFKGLFERLNGDYQKYQ